jgi:hypothetical protein
MIPRKSSKRSSKKVAVISGESTPYSRSGRASARACLFDLLISAQQDRWGYLKTERLGSLEVDDHLKFCRQLNG